MAEIAIITNDTRWKGQAPAIKRAIEATLKARKVKKAAVTVLLANDAEIKELNKTYRGKNKATNVLSFPNGEQEGGLTQLGDIILAYETIKKESREQKKSFKAHLTHLAIHGTLHLLGFDHENDKEADIMERCEIKILAGLKVANPYETA